MNKSEYIKDAAFSRNYGFWSEEEQEKLHNSKIAIAGVGGDGFQLGQRLAMMGVGHIVVADPEVFERENSNRVPGALVKNYGKNKAEAFREMVYEMRPETKVDIFNDGVNIDNIEDFLAGADLVLDESELTRLEIGTMIAREARKQKIPDLIVMNIGFAAIATSLKAEGGKTFENIMGIPKDAPLDEVAGINVDFSRCLPYLPKYADINSFIAAKDCAPLPSICIGVDAASAIGTTETFLHLMKGSNRRREPIWAPKFKYIDAYTNESGVIHAPRVSHYLGLLALTGRSLMGLNPKASYSEKDRLSRE